MADAGHVAWDMGSYGWLLTGNAGAIIGQQILIRKLRFEVIGVLSSKGSQGWQNPDEQILIPLNTARYRVFGTDRLRSIAVVVRDKVPRRLPDQSRSPDVTKCLTCG